MIPVNEPLIGEREIENRLDILLREISGKLRTGLG
jgi:hypothetical protein